ncbi:MAG: F0F1 ATP synthase subunit delta [Opitutales bacterium]|nr:F0F1 ATP synthase subunit delta [Opitutales bacterium]
MKAAELAKILVGLSENSEGKIDIGRVRAVLDYAEKNLPSPQRIKVLREYKGAMKSRIFADSARAEFAGGLDNAAKEAIARFVNSKNPRALLEFSENPDLIAGLKISVGDFVCENSLKMKLEDIARSFKA